MKKIVALFLLFCFSSPASASASMDCKNVATVAKALANRYLKGKFTRTEMRKFLKIELPADAPQDLVRKKKAFQNFNELFFPEDMGLEPRNDLTLKHQAVKELFELVDPKNDAALK